MVALGVAWLSVPGLPGHDPAALSVRLVGSDAGEALAAVSPFGTPPTDPCQQIEATDGVGNGLLRDDRFGFYASIWPTYQALEAFGTGALLPGKTSCGGDFDRTLTAVDADYWSGAPGGGAAAYDQGPAALHLPGDLPRVDDSLWMGMVAMEAYQRTRQPALVTRAEQVFALARANWDPRRGGIYWEDHAPGATDLDKAVVSNAPAAVIAVQLYLATGQPSYLAWGERIVAWLQANLLDRSTGLYDDGIDDHRTPPVVEGTTLTYDQGVVVEALGLLATAAPARYPLGEATALARRSMQYFAGHRTYGQPAFDAVWATSLLWLAGLDHQAAFTTEARASLEAAVAAEPRHPADLLGQAAEAELHELTALAPARYPLLVAR